MFVLNELIWLRYFYVSRVYRGCIVFRQLAQCDTINHIISHRVQNGLEQPTNGVKAVETNDA